MHNLDHSPFLQSPGRPFVLLRDVCRIILAQEKTDVCLKIGEHKKMNILIVLHVALLKDQNWGSKNPLGQVAVATKFCVMASNICGFSIWNVLHVTLFGA